MVTVPEKGVKEVNFSLPRIWVEGAGKTIKGGPGSTQDPSEEEFQSFIKELSIGSGLDQLIQSTATESQFRYRNYKELSEFLRGLHLNFPKIVSLRR